MLTTLQALSADESAADQLTLAERQLAIQCCDKLKSFLSASHLLRRNARLASAAASQVAHGTSAFPAELLLADYRDSIFANLGVRALGRATAVCKAWSSESAWQAAYQKRWVLEKGDFLPGKLAYALRDAYESRDKREAQLLCEHTRLVRCKKRLEGAILVQAERCPTR